jgi:hypothetical protein
MSVPARIGLFVGGLAVVFVAAFALGDLIDPEGADEDTTTHAGEAHQAASSEAATPRRIVVDDREFEPGVTETLSFRVLDRDGNAVEDFDVEHERAMHVIAVRRDLTGYQHVHPRRAGDGWEVDITFPEPGQHRVFADFASGGDSYTLATDIEVSGDYQSHDLPGPVESANAGNGYEVGVAARGSRRTYTVTKDGQPVEDIEPYLGARGHLVALRQGDLAFQHVHPTDEATAGREINFDVALTKAGSYRLFLQFQHEGEVQTAAFTERVSGDDPAGHGGEEHDHGH